MSNHIENPTAYHNAIKSRMILNGVKGRLTRMADDHPMLLRLILEVIEPAQQRQHAKWEAEREREAEREGWTFNSYDYSPWIDFAKVDLQASWIANLEWSEMDAFTFPQQLVLRYLKTKKGLSEKQEAWVTKMVEEEPQREAKIAARKAEYAAADAASGYVGEIKERLKDMTLTVEFAKRLDGGHYGPKMMLKLRDADSNLFVTFGTSEWLWGAEKGQQFQVTGTVKAHEDYQGAKQTILTRTKGVAL